MAAPAKMLGELRARLPKPLADALAADLAKDLVHIPLDDLPRHFEDVAAF
jgi:Protein required for attachment to host cells